MDLKALQEAGGFVADELVPETVKWKRKAGKGMREEDFRVFIKPMSAGAIEELTSGMKAGAKATRSLLIAESIRLGAEGKEKLTYEQAYSLKPELAQAMLDAIERANGTSEDADPKT